MSSLDERLTVPLLQPAHRCRYRVTKVRIGRLSALALPSLGALHILLNAKPRFV